jgi:hypothetical protein
MGGYMNCCHRSFTRRKNVSEQGRKRKRKKRSDIICGQYTNTYKLGENEISKISKIIKIDHNNF